MWYEQHYGGQLGKKKAEDSKAPEKKQSRQVKAKLAARSKDHVLDQHLKDQFNTGRLYACISSRPGQSGRADGMTLCLPLPPSPYLPSLSLLPHSLCRVALTGYILEGKELEFYTRRLAKKK